MLFPTIQFAIFFPVVLALIWLLMPQPRLWKPFIVVASYVFYAAADRRFCFLLGAITLANQLAARAASHATERRAPAQVDRGARRWRFDLAVLGVFKYYGFFIGDVDAPARRHRAGDAAAAAHDRAAGGRQLLHVPGDLVHGRRQAARSSSRARCSTSPSTSRFFPHLVAGPIVRAQEFLPQLDEPRDPRDVAVGAGSR